VSLSFSDPRSGAWSRDSGIEGHPLQTSWAGSGCPFLYDFPGQPARDRRNSTIASTMDNIHKGVRFGSRLSSDSGGRCGGGLQDAILLSAIFRDITSLFGKSIPLTGSIYLSIDSLATTTGQDRRSPNLPISLSEATITEGLLPYPLGIFSPLQLRILANHPRPKRDVVVRASLIASLLGSPPKKGILES
jgi:hypothetical protein